MAQIQADHVCTEQGRIARLETLVEQLDHTVNGNGQPGLDKVTRDFIAEWRGAEDERKRTEKSRTNRRDWLTFAILALTLVVAWLELRHNIARADTQPSSQHTELPPQYSFQ